MAILKGIKWNQVVVAFLLGAFVTAGVIRWRCGVPWPVRGEARHHYLLKKFSTRLNLTEEQKQKVGAILEAKREKIRTIRHDMKPRFDEIWQNTREEIRQVLNPEQQKKFEALNAELEEHWKRKRRWKER